MIQRMDKRASLSPFPENLRLHIVHGISQDKRYMGDKKVLGSRLEGTPYRVGCLVFICMERESYCCRF